MIRSIFGRILLSNCVVILITAVTCLLLTGYLLHSHFVEGQKNDILMKGQAALNLIIAENRHGHKQLQQNIDKINELVGATCWIVDENSQTVTGIPPENWLVDYPEAQGAIAKLAREKGESWLYRSSRRGDRSILLALTIPEINQPRILVMHASTPRVNKQADRAQPLLLYGAIAGLLVAATFAFFISRSLTWPLANISNAARRFASGDFNARTTATGNSEIGRLGQTFNSMAKSFAAIEQNRREFLANVTHELKTPTTSIQAMTEALLDNMVPPQQERAFLTAILQASRRMDRLTNDLLDLSKLEAGEMPAIQEVIELAGFLKNQIKLESILFQEKGVRLELDVTEGLYVLADSCRLAQVLTNLLSNARRYSPPNTLVTVAAKRQGKKVLITVVDQGKGIAEKDLPYIWDRFYRVDKARSREDGGTGLGLAITKYLVELMNGRIYAQSTLGQGSTFTIELPLSS
ncbi:MAG: HAMP domain-containing sensor histidine kinase [Sporomusaceae bacterium]|nr:HAMP domain-containing sensor histidine kinase [Sporomusaceae bacterium]